MKGTPWSLKGNGGFQQLHYPGLSDFVPKEGDKDKDKEQPEKDQKKDKDKAGTEDQTIQTDVPVTASDSSLARLQPQVRDL